MNPIEHRLSRLLEAAQKACPPIPEPSPWFEQRMIQALRTEAAPLSNYIESVLIFRILAVAAIIMVASAILPFAQPKDPYTENMNLANSTLQLVQMR
jgi:hypothetical protein